MSAGGRPVVAVIGAGIAGLAAAWELVTNPGEGVTPPEVHVFEREQRVGGKLAAARFAGRTVDLGADAFLGRRPEAIDLCNDLGIQHELVPVGASGASVFARGRLRSLPGGLVLGLPTRWWPLARSGVLSPLESLRVSRDVLVPHPGTRGVVGDRSVGDIVDERLGRAVVDRLVDPLIGGINAGGVDDLSTAATFPVLLAASHQPGSLMHRVARAQRPPAQADPGSPAAPVFWSLRAGTASLAERLGERLGERGVVLHTGVSVDALTRENPGNSSGQNSSGQNSNGHSGSGQNGNGAQPTRGRWHLVLGGTQALAARDRNESFAADAVICALPAPGAAALLAVHAPMAAGLLATIEYASVAVVTVAVPSDAIGRPLSGTGFLVPRTAALDGRLALVTGCTYLSRKWPHLAVPGLELLRISVGRHGDTRAADLDDDELGTSTYAQCAGILAIDGAPSATMVTRWEHAFPQYRTGHLIRVAKIEESVAELPALAVAGAATRGVGIPACIGSGRQAGRAVLRSLVATGAGRR